MLNEHEKEDGQDGPEEGEYHFSDEGGYESNIEEEEAKAPVVSERGGGLAAKFSSYRRFVIIGAIAAGVLLVVYLVIPPLTTSAPSEIAAVTPPAAPTETAVPVTAEAKTIAPQPKAGPVMENHKITKTLANFISNEKEKLLAEQNKIMGHPAAPPAPASLSSSAPQPPAESAAGTIAETALPPSLAGAPPSLLSPAAQEFIASPVGALPSGQPAAVQAAAENKVLLDRLTAMEETNTKLIGQLQAEYAQKVTVYEVQDKALQEQVRTLNTRLASMEAEMGKLVQAINKQQAAASSENMNSLSANNGPDLAASPAAGPPGPMIPPAQANYKANYTVQAIIPGRAWLRTDGGETITVAEGDTLKNLGRVTKIDPYDGTIQIDTGSKVVTLTYGNGDYA